MGEEGYVVCLRKPKSTTTNLPVLQLPSTCGASSAEPLPCIFTFFFIDTENFKEPISNIFYLYFRRMFPTLQFSLKGMRPSLRYSVMVDMSLTVPSQFKFTGGTWTKSGQADSQIAKSKMVLYLTVCDSVGLPPWDHSTLSIKSPLPRVDALD